MLVETINNRKTGGATESTVFGPFHMIESPRRALGESIDFVGTGTPCVVAGRVLSADGTPLPGAELDVWQASDQGFYDVQQPGVQPRTNGAACSPRMRTGPSGSARSCRATTRSRPTARSARC
jgi:Protocatechuate 3,4-dioxygenase beta subunit